MVIFNSDSQGNGQRAKVRLVTMEPRASTSISIHSSACVEMDSLELHVLKVRNH